LPAFTEAGDQAGFEAATKNIHTLYADRRNRAALEDHTRVD
jgi:hypothetical protein